MAFNILKSPVEVTERIMLMTFQNSDLTTGTLTINHKFVTKVVTVEILDPNGSPMPTTGLIVDTTVYNKLTLNFGGNLPAGVHLCILKFYI
jgi:hypothetical protein